MRKLKKYITEKTMLKLFFVVPVAYLGLTIMSAINKEITLSVLFASVGLFSSLSLVGEIMPEEKKSEQDFENQQ